MKIDRIETFSVPPRWLFIRVETDDGHVGWGEAIIGGRPKTIEAAVEEVGELILGKDARAIRELWTLMYRSRFYRGGPVVMTALAGLDQALWDIKGKYLGVPVWELLGGPVRKKARVYSWVGGDGKQDIDKVIADAKQRAADGFTAIKLNAVERFGRIESPGAVDRVVARHAQLRAALGPDIQIALDFHGRVSKTMAKVLVKELEAVRPFFIEEPVLPYHTEALAEVKSASNIPIALGERYFVRWEFKHLFENRFVDIVQPDLSHAGGITEVMQIASMAEAYDVAIAPHCPLGPLALSSSLQVDFSAPNFLIQEQSLGIHYNTSNDLLDYLKDPSVFKYVDGYVEAPQGPGLGVELKEEVVRERSHTQEAFRNPVWRLEDDSITEW